MTAILTISGQWRLYHSNYGRGGNSTPKPDLVAPATWLAAPMLPHTRVHTEGMFLWRMDKTIGQLLHSMGRLPGMNEDDRHPQLAAGPPQDPRSRMIDQKYIHPHYQHVDGTSMAAPVVSAVAAQMLEANPTLSPDQVREILIATATPLPPACRRRGTAPGWSTPGGRWPRPAAPAAVYGAPAFLPSASRTECSFYYFNPVNQAASVALIGSFNDWDPTGYDLHSHSPGLWQLSIPSLPRGAYRYKFLVDDPG